MKNFKQFLTEESGAAVVETILLLVVIIGVVLIFKSEITELVNDIFDKIFSQAGRI